MRVAILGQFPADPSRFTSGVEAAIVSLVENLPAAGVTELHVIASRSDAVRATTHVGTAVIHNLPRPSLDRVTLHRRETGAMQAVLRQINPDIVHAHTTVRYAGAAVGSGFPNVVTAHGILAREVPLFPTLGMRLRGMIDIPYERYCLSRATDLIAISPYVQNELQPHTHARFHLIENPVEAAFFDLQPQPEPGRVLFVGAVIERKGVDILVRALSRVKEAMPHVHLRVAGELREQEYAQSVIALAEKIGIAQHIDFLGLLGRQQILDEYARCSLLVLPSLQETAPISIEQAMAAGVPVVATPAGGVPALVADGQTGLLVAMGDERSLASAIIRLLGDGELSAQHGTPRPPRGRQTLQARCRRPPDQSRL